MRKPMAVGLSLAICFAAEARVQNQGGPSNTSNVSDTAHSATKAAHPARIYVAPEVEATKLIRRVNSVYPERAEVEGITGTVVCRVIVSTDGSVKELEYVSGPEVLKQAAMDAVKEWRYKPTMLNGKPVEVDTTVQVIFALNEPDQSGAQPPKPGAANDSHPIGARAHPDSQAPAQDPNGPINLPDTPPLVVPETRWPTPHNMPPVRIRVGGNVQARSLVHKVAPAYPDEARAEHVSGTVVLHLIVAWDGSVQSVNYVSGPDLLKQAAIDAVKQWRYEPTYLNGEPVEVDTTIQIVFTLS